jgi:hypothetical protein
MREMFEPKMEEVTGGWTKLRKKELHNLYSTQNIIWAMKYRRMKCAERVARWQI